MFTETENRLDRLQRSVCAGLSGGAVDVLERMGEGAIRGGANRGEAKSSGSGSVDKELLPYLPPSASTGSQAQTPAVQPVQEAGMGTIGMVFIGGAVLGVLYAMFSGNTEGEENG